MAIWERVLMRLGAVRRLVQAAERRGLREGMDVASLDDEPALTFGGKAMGRGYREIHSTPRDLSGWSQERAIEAAYRLWQSHPLAGALTEIVVDYVIGNGVSVTCESEAVEEVLRAFLADPVNDLVGADGAPGQGLESLVRELGLFGEALVLAFVRDGSDIEAVGDGLVRLGSVDPAQIHSLITAEGNRREVVGVRLKSKTGGGDGPVYRLVRAEGAGGPLLGMRNLGEYRMAAGRGGAALREAVEQRRQVQGREWIVREAAERRLQAAEGELVNVAPVGDAFLWQVNRISTGMRGRPDLLRMLDWLDRFDQVFFDGAEHAALLNMFSWDLQVNGGSATAAEPERNLTAQANIVAKLKPGSVYAHNENAALEAKNPDLKTADMETLIRQLRVFISGGARVPEHWIAEGGYTNRATAAEMGQPTFRMLSRRQAMVRRMVTQVCQFQVDAAVALGRLPETVTVEDGEGAQVSKPAREAFALSMADINEKDTARAAQVLRDLAQAVLGLRAGKLMTQQTAVELTAQAALLLGVEIDVEQTLAELEAEGIEQRPAPDQWMAGNGQGNGQGGGKSDGEDEGEDEDETAAAD